MPPYNTDRASGRRSQFLRQSCSRTIIRSRVASSPPCHVTDGLVAKHQNDALTSQFGRECLVVRSRAPRICPDLMYKLRATRRVSVRAWRWSMTVRLSYVAPLWVCMVIAIQPLSSQSVTQAPAAAAPVALKGTLERIKIHGKSLEGNLLGESPEPEVSIYLPPSYGTDRTRRYPVVYLLHGYTSTDLGYFGPSGRQLHVIAERVFASGAAREMILVMPNAMNAFGGSMYSNSVTAGNWEGYVADDLVALHGQELSNDRHARRPRARRSLDGRLRHAPDRDEAPRRLLGDLRAQFLLPQRRARCADGAPASRRRRNWSRRWRRRAGIGERRGRWRARRPGRRIRRTRPSIWTFRRRTARSFPKWP